MGGRWLGLLPRWWMRVQVSDVVTLMVWCLSLRKQRAASCRSARPGCASGKGLRGDPERNEIDGFGHFVFDLGGSPLERAEGLAPKPCEAGAGRVRDLVCACARDRNPKGRDAFS